MAAPVKFGDVVHLVPKINKNTGEISPYPRSGHCCAADDSNLYIYGGYNPVYEVRNVKPVYNKLFRELWSYNFSTCTWTLENDTNGEIPEETASMSMAISGNCLLLFGGTSFPWGEKSNKDVYVYLIKQKKWDKLQCIGDSPPAKYGQAAVLRSGNLYVFGGCRKIANDNFHFDAELYKLNLESCIWEKLAGSECSNEIQPEGMYRHGIACDDHKLYVLGYSWSEVYTIPHLHKIYAYDLKLSMWESLSTHPDYLKGFPPTRIYHSCAQRNNDVFISGGHNNSLIYDDLWRLNLTTLQWTSLNKLPIKSFFHTASITPSGCMYYFGGVTKLDDSSRTGETYRIWLEVPSLFELCWYHVSSLIPDLDSLSDERLITLGIPRSLIGRVRAG